LPVGQTLSRGRSAASDRAIADMGELVDFGSSYSVARTQTRIAPKQVAAAASAAAAASCITARLMSCDAHCVAAPSVKPLELQVCFLGGVFVCRQNLPNRSFVVGMDIETLCLSGQCRRCVSIDTCASCATSHPAPGYNGHSACRNVVACAGDRGGEGVWWTSAQHLVFARTRAPSSAGGSSMSPLQHCYSPAPTSSCGVITSLAFCPSYAVVAAVYAGTLSLIFYMLLRMTHPFSIVPCTPFIFRIHVPSGDGAIALWGASSKSSAFPILNAL
jgi:hypothetical protein